MNKATQQKYWFKRRRYGYGWVPVTWQGWVSIVVMLSIILIGSYLFSTTSRSTEDLWLYINMVVMTILLFIFLTLVKGPSPKWRWGQKADDDPDLDF